MLHSWQIFFSSVAPIPIITEFIFIIIKNNRYVLVLNAKNPWEMAKLTDQKSYKLDCIGTQSIFYNFSSLLFRSRLFPNAFSVFLKWYVPVLFAGSPWEMVQTSKSDHLEMDSLNWSTIYLEHKVWFSSNSTIPIAHSKFPVRHS